ncbi:hypothetical protein L1887_19181 [Cichorium endivia]|nr:hypothetical protein L1887_19181 [Cichorium endivia]
MRYSLRRRILCLVRIGSPRADMIVVMAEVVIVVVDGVSDMILLKTVPIEVLCFIWRAKLGRILVAKVLAVRGIHIPSVLWRCCHVDEELVDHELASCNRAKETKPTPQDQY